MKKINGKLYIFIIITILIAFTLTAGGCLNYGNFFFDSEPESNPPANQTQSTVEIKTLSESTQALLSDGVTVTSVDNSSVNYTIAEVAALVSDSVVELSVTISSKSASGSGVLFATDNSHYYVVTNHHVIDGASVVKVKLTDGTTKVASVIASNSEFDVGVVSIPKSGIDGAKYKTVVIPSDSYKIRVGDTAIAIGNPLGTLGGTVTSGIVSALDRQITVDETTMTLLQTDAAINQGNSGGGLFDSHGQLIGIVNAKMMATGIEGLGFAIPVRTAVSVACDLITKGYVTGKPQIGVTVMELNSNLKIQNFLSEIETEEERNKWNQYFTHSGHALGLYIYEVTNADSGLKVGDFIMSVNGASIVTTDSLGVILSTKKAGDKLTVAVKRSGTTIPLEITLIQRTNS